MTRANFNPNHRNGVGLLIIVTGGLHVCGRLVQCENCTLRRVRHYHSDQPITLPSCDKSQRRPVKRCEHQPGLSRHRCPPLLPATAARHCTAACHGKLAAELIIDREAVLRMRQTTFSTLEHGKNHSVFLLSHFVVGSTILSHGVFVTIYCFQCRCYRNC